MKEDFLKTCTYMQGSYTEEDAFEKLRKEIERLEDDMAPGQPANRIFYLALPPQIFMAVTTNIKRICLSSRSVNCVHVILQVYSTLDIVHVHTTMSCLVRCTKMTS